MIKKYELVKEQKIILLGTTLYRIRACKDFTTVSGREVYAGDLGGYIESKKTSRRTAELGLAAIVS